MSRKSTKILKAALTALHAAGADRLFRPMTQGAGIIFMLHHVRPEPPRAFEPNRILKVTPEFLESVIREVSAQGLEPVSLDEAARRLEQGDTARPFACFTLDDGYRDNLLHAYPIFKRYGVPFTVYVPAHYPGGGDHLWWLALEEAIRRSSTLVVEMDGETRRFDVATVDRKDAAFHDIYWWLRRLPEREARAVVAEMARQAGHDGAKLAADLLMTWDEVRALASDPLVTIGAHTCRHLALSGLPEAEARAEIEDSIRRIEAETGKPCRHFSYPYGDESTAGEREFSLAREAGVVTAVTTRKGLVEPGHKDTMTALPRLSLNGDYQDMRHVKVLMSGVPFALMNVAKRLLRAACNPSRHGTRQPPRDAARRVRRRAGDRGCMRESASPTAAPCTSTR